ncbi:uncharacterized protein LOC106644002 [Copidosoma floridanum]|uniref:uncharacterized protein LOC106644002 n=1 Tax=Copidosoma floridanum TaxID=29053 RepID=UPI0006C953AF|nr:uncharacterized protein LOC106644002 [Copidosoma floridanum]
MQTRSRGSGAELSDSSFVKKHKLLQLPIAELPNFDGTSEQWLSFSNSLKFMVDERTDIDDLVQFTYLKACMKGDVVTADSNRREEIMEAECKVISLIQQERFTIEIKGLSTHSDEIDRINKSGKRTTRFDNLNPFIDEHGLIRVGRRLKHSELRFNQKNTILLPTNHNITDLIIRQTHLEPFHAGIQTTLYFICNKLWILKGKDQVRHIMKRCVHCMKQRPRSLHGQMAELPACRVNETPLFYHLGTDFFGPIFIKETKLHYSGEVKVYGCIFVCMPIKAVHLKISTNLSTAGCLGVLHHFMNRRRVPAYFYIDNGTIFVGANNELKEIYAIWNPREHIGKLKTYFESKQITWHFNPPLPSQNKG